MEQKTCDSVRRDDRGKAHRCGARATWMVRARGCEVVYLCDEHHDRWRRAVARPDVEVRI